MVKVPWREKLRRKIIFAIYQYLDEKCQFHQEKSSISARPAEPVTR
jgi:hypothetical protein